MHCAAVGVLKTLKPKNRAEVPPANDHRYMINVVTSQFSGLAPCLSLLKKFIARCHRKHAPVSAAHKVMVVSILTTSQKASTSASNGFSVSHEDT